jgi:hypothetical protein
MSTRCQVILTDKWGEKLWFYRHSDGYLSGVLPTLIQFMKWIEEGKIRANTEQSGGWLIMLGAREYDTIYTGKTPDWYRKKKSREFFEPGSVKSISGWKVGAYEPCPPGMKGDIEYLYTISLTDFTIYKQETVWPRDPNAKLGLTLPKVIYRIKDRHKVSKD